MKVVKIEIENCVKCPYIKHEKVGKHKQYLKSYCCIIKEKEELPENFTDTIPDWCLLPDAERQP